MRRIITAIVIFVFALSAFAGSAFAAPQFSGEVKQHAVLLIDAKSGTRLWEKNADERIEPASTTKILTCILALESGISLDTKVKISEKAAGVSGSSLDLATGEEVSLGDLLAGMMMFSGNDAATAVAETVSGDVASFVTLMNAKAQALGMTGTNFTSPHGKHDENHYSTAADMAKLMQYAMQNPAFMEIVDNEQCTLPQSNKRQSKTYKNTNFLMRSDKDAYYPYATGGKTGSTDQAGACLVASAAKDNMSLICLIFNDKSAEGIERWSTAKQLFDFGFNNFVTIDIQQLLDTAEPVKAQVENYASTDESDGLLVFEGPQSPGTYQTIDKALAQGILDGTDKIIADEPVFTSTLQAPILKGEVLGTVVYRSEATGEPIYTGNLIASRDVLQAGAEPDAQGGTAVSMMPAMNIEELKKEDNGVLFLLIIPVILIGLLVWRMLTVTRRKRKRFNRKRPHYSYKIR